MTPRLHRRIISAAFLAATLLLFVPVLLLEPAPAPTPRYVSATIPKPPPLPQVQITALPPDLEPAIQKQYAQHDSAWLIQVASLSDGTRAAALVTTLRQAHFPAFMSTWTHEGKRLNRVLVGPFAERVHAAEKLRLLSEKNHLKGFLLSYNPVLFHGQEMATA